MNGAFHLENKMEVAPSMDVEEVGLPSPPFPNTGGSWPPPWNTPLSVAYQWGWLMATFPPFIIFLVVVVVVLKMSIILIF